MRPIADRRTDRLKLAGAAAILFAAAFLVYMPCLRGAEMWNDSDYLTSPELISLHGLWRIWFDVGATQQYYPLLHTAFWIEHRLWGGSMLGYHLINVALHATVACLFGLLLRRLAVPGAFLAALVVAVHPVFVESVAWITEQKNTLSGVFFFCSALAYFRWEDPGGNPAAPSEARPARGTLGWYFLALVLYVCAVLSKTVTAPLPAALLVVAWWRRGGRSWRRDVLPLVPWFAAGAGGGLFSAWVERTYIGATGAPFAMGFGQRILIAGRAVWFYVGKLAWPAGLNFNYPRWNVSTSEAWQFVFPLAAAALLAAFWRLSRRNRAPLAAALLYGGLLFPVMGFFNVYSFVYSFVADHYAYLAFMAIIALGAAGWELARKKDVRRRKAMMAAAAAVLLVFGCLSRRQAGDYTDQETFYRAIVARNPESWMAYNNLGDLLRAEGRSREAIPDYKTALRLNPNAKAHFNLAVALADVGNLQEAVSGFGQAIALLPDFPAAHYNRAVAYVRLGQYPDAVADYRTALRGDQTLNLDPKSHYNLAVALVDAGNLQEAVSEFSQAIALAPEFSGAHYNRGLTYARLGQYQDAIADYRAALRIDPTLSEAHSSLGYALISYLGDLPRGTEECRKAVELSPNLPDVRLIFGYALAAAHRYPEAIEQYRAAERLDPKYPETHNYLGEALAAEGRVQEAAAEFETALRLHPGDAEARRNLEAAIPR